VINPKKAQPKTPMLPPTPDDGRSPLGKKIHAAMAKRPSQIFPVQGYFANTLGQEVAEVAIRIASSREQDTALVEAHKYVGKMAGAIESAKHDDDLIIDAKNAGIISVCVREVGSGLPIWPSIETVKEDLGSDLMGVLVRLINEVRARIGPIPEELDDTRIEALINAAVMLAETSAPDGIVAALPHTYLTQAFILTALKVDEARQERDALRKELAELRAKMEGSDVQGSDLGDEESQSDLPEGAELPEPTPSDG
jgi:hypothetical protein